MDPTTASKAENDAYRDGARDTAHRIAEKLHAVGHPRCAEIASDTAPSASSTWAVGEENR